MKERSKSFRRSDLTRMWSEFVHIYNTDAKVEVPGGVTLGMAGLLGGAPLLTPPPLALVCDVVYIFVNGFISLVVGFSYHYEFALVLRVVP